MPFAAIFWLAIAVWLNCAGWLLAILHQLNPAGWGCALLPGLLWAGYWSSRQQWRTWFSTQKMRRRFRRPLPAVFLGLTVLIAIGGMLYAPTNYDALTYRLPRMLNWLAAGKWFWISAVNDRMNYSGTGWEWTAMPLLELSRSDRAFFLINLSGFLLLPGLLFSIFRQLGVARRVAWTWMWVLPLAFGYATQAGSIGNDLMGCVLCVASVDFGLRARRTGRLSDVWLALLAAALMTGVKLSNAPLALPCLVAVWPALRTIWQNWVPSLALAVVAVVVSAAPIIGLNLWHTGSWTGDPANLGKMQIKNPVAALLGNSLLVGEQTFMPPVLPVSSASDKIDQHLPASFLQLLARDYPRYRQNRLNELPSEEGAGLGLGITLLMLAGAAGTLWMRIRKLPNEGIRFRIPWVALAGWAAGMVYLLKMGTEAAPRLMLPYYPLLLVPFLLLPGQQWFLRRRVGRVGAVLAALCILPALILSPLRPLWPGQIVCEKLSAQHPDQHLFQRMADTYSAYAHRNDLLAPLRAALPDDARRIGLVAGSNDTDYSLWRPFGHRQVIYLCANPQPFLAHPGSVDWLVVKAIYWPDFCKVPLEEWAKANHFQVTLSTNLVELVSWGGENWLLLHRQTN